MNHEQHFTEKTNLHSIERYANSGIPLLVWQKINLDIANGKLSESYQETVLEMEDPTIHFSGENPLNEDSIINFVNEKFNLTILKLALVSSIELKFDEIKMDLPDDNFLKLKAGSYNIPENKFRKIWEKLTVEEKENLSEYIYRGETYAKWYTDKHTKNKYFSSPVVIYNQEFDSKNRGLMQNNDLFDLGLDFLKKIPKNQRREKYILGTIAHEIAHHIYAYLILTDNQRQKQWKKIIDTYGDITEYSQSYNKNENKDYDENFAETVRIYTTNFQYLIDNKLTEHIKFIEDNFPDIKKQKSFKTLY